MPSFPFRLAGLALVTGLALAACGGDHKPSDTQTAVKVGSAELTVHQLNYLLQQRNGVPADQAERAGRELLERLIDQELAAQAAVKDGLDRDPRTVQALDAARREVLARAYGSKVERDAIAAGKPKPEEIERFYNDNPLLFSNRQLYAIEQVGFDGADASSRADSLLRSRRSPQAFRDALTAAGVRPVVQNVTIPAENLPLDQLKRFSELASGDSIIVARPGGATVLFLLGSTPAAVGLVQARPAIERYLQADQARRAVADATKALRAATPVTYVGKFAQPLAAPAAGGNPGAGSAAAGAPAVDPAALRKGLDALK